jgi:hypothetical protein
MQTAEEALAAKLEKNKVLTENESDVTGVTEGESHNVEV